MKKKRIILYLVATLIGASAIASSAPQTVFAASSDTSVISSITSAFEQKKTTLTINMTTAQLSRINSLIDRAALQADAYARYTLDRVDTRYSTRGSKANVQLTISYLENKQQSDYVTAQAKATLKTIVKPGMSQEEKVKVIHDYIVKRFAYDESLTFYSAYDGLTKGTTVCQGYALLGYRMLTLAGIENRMVEGAAGGQAHVWNKVKVNGNWYNLDMTWDDPTPDRKNEVSYSYYLVTDKLLARDHTWKRTGVPTATADYRTALAKKAKTSAKYRNLLSAIGGEMTYSTAALQQKVLASIAKGKSDLTVQHDFNVASPQLALDQIMKACRKTTIKNVRYAYKVADNGIATVKFLFDY
ncbi:transglutaminase domain-containing protein [Saccharibacillus sp. JS10]|uniref:transglutaminase domain-containing protein n=1 Tax=Saccharibacillus sp. JS10 TaxID=2950552 RepID=UPI00210EFF23|nr:transglutaminase domain-containing protein [Saccharibacillus sp. JS10]MCQ4087261.1 transglutaminase [Saccharibacillus sp. JS10]